MSIHTSHPFPTPDDPVRRLRGRVEGAVSLWTAGGGADAAGLTVTSLLVAGGEPGRVLALLDPDSDLAETLIATGRGVVQLLSWRHRDLADAFAGVAPAPGGPFRVGSFTTTPAGPRLTDAAVWALATVEQVTDVGWMRLVTCAIDELVVGDDDDPLLHRRGRYLRVPGGAST